MQPLPNPATNARIADRFINELLRAIAFSMDNLIPGLYFWLGTITLRIGGDTPDDQPYRYPGTIHSFLEQAELLRMQRFEDVDWVNVIEVAIAIAGVCDLRE